jgi:hypothetical protein
MRFWKSLTVTGVMALSIAAFACDRSETRTTTDTTPAPGAARPSDAAPAANTGIKVDELVKNMERYVGQEVTVIGEVDEVLSPQAFTLDEEAILAAGIDNDVLVFYPKSAELAPLDDAWLKDEVRVTGTVGRMTVTEIEREVGWDLDPKIEVEVEKKGPVLIAKRVERVR